MLYSVRCSTRARTYAHTDLQLCLLTRFILEDGIKGNFSVAKEGRMGRQRQV